MDDTNRKRVWKILHPLGTKLAITAYVVNNILVTTSLPLDYKPNIPRWKLGKGGMYIVKYGYLALLEEGESDFPIKKVWIKGITSKVTHFIWLVFRK